MIWPEIRASEGFLGSNGRILPDEMRTGSSALTIEATAGNRKKFKMLAYSGGKLALKEYDLPVVVDLAGMTIAAQAMPMLGEHHGKAGESESIAITAKGLEISGYVDAETDDGKLIVAAKKGGFDWEGSIGASVQAMEVYAAGESVNVNGQTFTGPVYVARKTTLKETSFVKRGADTGATRVDIAASGVNAMEPKFEAFIKAAGFDPATITDPQKIFLKASFDAAEKAKETPPPAPTPTPTPIPAINAAADLQAIRDELKKDREERAEMARIADVTARCVGNPDVLATAIKEKWTPDRTELEILRRNRPDIQIITTDAGRTEIKASDCFEAALCISAGINEARVGKWFNEKIMNEATSQRFRGARLSTIMFEVIRAAGMHTRMGAITDETIRTALRADRKVRSGPDIRAEGFTSLSLSGILSNLANKRMIASYEAAAVVWPNFCAIRDHNDFKVHSRYRLDSTGSMRKLGPDGELKNISLQDATYTNQIDTYGGIIALTRQMQINDDMGAFLQIPDVFGRLARIRPEEAFFVLLLANATSFFHANNKNLITTASGVMTAANGIAAITLAETAFSNQVDPNNKPILVPPDRMLLGTVNYVPARNIYEGRMKITGKDQTEVSQNEHAGKYTPYKSAFVNNTAVKDENGAAITGQSSTVWWLFADPAVRCAIAMAFLNGNQIPTIQSEDAEFDTLGMQWRCFFDFGVGYEDPVAAVQINGA